MKNKNGFGHYLRPSMIKEIEGDQKPEDVQE